MSRQGPVNQLKKSNKQLNHGVVIVKTEYNSNLQCMCKTTHITHTVNLNITHLENCRVWLISFFQNLFEKHVLSISCTKRAGNLISKSQ